jgi:hypothetical protein
MTAFMKKKFAYLAKTVRKAFSAKTPGQKRQIFVLTREPTQA